jgi:hypothetical protein
MGIPINVLIQLMFSIDPAATSEYNQRTQHNSGATPHSQVPPRYFPLDFALVLLSFDRGWPRGGPARTFTRRLRGDPRRATHPFRMTDGGSG